MPPTAPNKKNPMSCPDVPVLGRGSPRRLSNVSKGRLNHVDAEEAQEAPDVVLGTFLVNLVPVRVLFDSGASHSFVTESFVHRSGIKPRRMEKSMIEQILGSKTKAVLSFPEVPVIIEGVEFSANLIVLGAQGLEVILGMDWMSKYHGRIDCTKNSID